MNEMMPKDKKAVDNISVAMPAGFEEEFSSSPTLMELRDELRMDYFPVHMPAKGWTKAECRRVGGSAGRNGKSTLRHGACACTCPPMICCD